MKKIPTLFTRMFENHRIIDIKDEITHGCEEAFLHGVTTVKFDGTCCAVIDGIFYKRYDAKKGKKPPEGAIPCDEPDTVTGHWPHWVKVDSNNPSDKFLVKAYENTSLESKSPDGTYEAVAPHINGNPHNYDEHFLIPHGKKVLYVERNFNDIKDFLKNNYIEGIVFWLNGQPVCKIKRSDFGFNWG